MTEHDWALFFRDISRVAPWLTGGDVEAQADRAALMDEWIGSRVTLDDARGAFGALQRLGLARDQLTWSLIIRETLDRMRRRIDTVAPAPKSCARCGLPRRNRHHERSSDLKDAHPWEEPSPEHTEERAPRPADFLRMVEEARDRTRLAAARAEERIEGKGK